MITDKYVFICKTNYVKVKERDQQQKKKKNLFLRLKCL